MVTSEKRPVVDRMRTISMEGRFLCTLSDGAKAFVKISNLADARDQRLSRVAIEREKTCLQVLAELAVPEVLPLRKSQLPMAMRGGKTAFLAQSDAGKPVDHAGLSDEQLVAAWLFVTEQLVAFKRYQIIYTDLKCANVLAKKRPFQVRVVDFGCAAPAVNGSTLLPRIAGITRGFDPPEIAGGDAFEQFSEASCVYQLGMLLAHTLSGLNNDRATHKRSALRRAYAARLRALGAAELIDIVDRCLARDPADRPADYDAVLAMVQQVELSPAIRRQLARLRKPYGPALEELGLQ